jgi:hypothetical protein
VDVHGVYEELKSVRSYLALLRGITIREAAGEPTGKARKRLELNLRSQNITLGTVAPYPEKLVN